MLAETRERKRAADDSGLRRDGRKFEMAAGVRSGAYSPQRTARMTGLRKITGLGRLTGSGPTVPLRTAPLTGRSRP